MTESGLKKHQRFLFNVYKRFFYFCHVFYVFNVFFNFFFLERFFLHLWSLVVVVVVVVVVTEM